jgi:hypothetical protein
MSEMETARPIENTVPRGLARSAVSEWSFVLLVAAGMLVITSLPYLFGYLSAPPDKQFMGILLDVPDHAQYFSWMRDLSTANFIQDKLTPEASAPIFFNLLWWGLGHLGLFLGVGYAGIFQVLRVGATLLFLVLLYRVCSFFLADRRQRRLAFLVASLTSGFGWVLVILKYALHQSDVVFPMDLYIAEGNTFLGILGYPHFIAAALYIFVFDLLLRGHRKASYLYSLAAGLAALFLGWQHAYDLVSVYGVMGAYTVLLALRDRKIPVFWVLSIAIVGSISWWPALYSVWLTSADPVWKQILGQFVNAGVFTPGPLHLLILFGPAFLIALATVVRMNPVRLRKLDNASLFLVAWFLVTFVLIYLPVNYQIHLLNGWQVPIAILAVRGLYTYGRPLAAHTARLFHVRPGLISRDMARKVLPVILVAAILPTNLYLFAWRFVDLSRHDYPYYLSNDEVASLHWLEGQGSQNDVVFSSLTIGQYVPMLTGKHAYLAHWADTLDYYGKSAAVAQFYASGTDVRDRLMILLRYRVRYVILGPAERSLGGVDLTALPGMQPVFKEGQVEIYQFHGGPNWPE